VLDGYGLSAEATTVRLTALALVPAAPLVQVNLRVHGAPARIQAWGPTPRQAIEAAAERLSRHISQLMYGGDAAWTDPAWPERARQNPPAGHVGTVARVKHVRPRTVVACQAVATMKAMDYDVHLFVDAETGEEAIVHRTGPGGIRLARQQRMHPPARSGGVDLTVHPYRTPSLTVAAAAGRLVAGRWPFYFFTSAQSGRGNLIYRRYDGDLCLVSPDGDPS